MAIVMDKMIFEGPFEIDGHELPNSSGIYFVSTKSAGGIKILGIYDGDDIAASFRSNGNRQCWKKYSDDGLTVYYVITNTSKEKREAARYKMINDRFYTLPCIDPISDDF